MEVLCLNVTLNALNNIAYSKIEKRNLVLIKRVRAVFHKTVRVCHFYWNFKLGFTCPITVIFGTLKDGSLLTNTLASSICFSYKNMFQNGVDSLSKIVDAFLSKSSKFYLVRIIRKCPNFASLWHKHLLRNYKWHFRLPMSAFATAKFNTLSKHQLFTLNFAFQLFMFPLLLITVEVKIPLFCNSLITMFTTSWRNLIKIGWSELYKILSFFLQKAVSYVNHSGISLAPFHYSKNYGSLTHETRIKDAVNIEDITCATVRTLNNATYQRETLSERPIRQPLNL